MIHKFKLLCKLFSCAGVILLSLVSVTTQAEAARKKMAVLSDGTILYVPPKPKPAKIISNKKITKKAVHLTKGTIYSSAKLTKFVDDGENYKHTTFYRTKQAKVIKTNGKKAIYQYIKTANNKVKGWIWHGYLKKGKAPKLKKIPFNATKVNQDFLAVVNKARAKKHLKPLRVDDHLAKIATQWSINCDKYDGDYPNEMAYPGYDTTDGYATSAFDQDNDAGKSMAEEFLHPTFTEKTAKHLLLDPDVDAIGLGWSGRVSSLVVGIKLSDAE